MKRSAKRRSVYKNIKRGYAQFRADIQKLKLDMHERNQRDCVVSIDPNRMKAVTDELVKSLRYSAIAAERLSMEMHMTLLDVEGRAKKNAF